MPVYFIVHIKPMTTFVILRHCKNKINMLLNCCVKAPMEMDYITSSFSRKANILKALLHHTAEHPPHKNEPLLMQHREQRRYSINLGVAGSGWPAMGSCLVLLAKKPCLFVLSHSQYIG